MGIGNLVNNSLLLRNSLATGSAVIAPKGCPTLKILALAGLRCQRFNVGHLDLDVFEKHSNLGQF